MLKYIVPMLYQVIENVLCCVVKSKHNWRQLTSYPWRPRPWHRQGQLYVDKWSHNRTAKNVFKSLSVQEVNTSRWRWLKPCGHLISSWTFNDSRWATTNTSHVLNGNLFHWRHDVDYAIKWNDENREIFASGFPLWHYLTYYADWQLSVNLN